jgi:general stress protein YciG
MTAPMTRSLKMKKLTKKQAGRLGGQRTAQLHGAGYMREIGRKGARAFHQKYAVKPAGTCGWALVRREDNLVVTVFDCGYLDKRLGLKGGKLPIDKNPSGGTMKE